jgi:hypothetical protein
VITNGAYSIPAESGPTPGKYKVTIRSAGESGAAPAADEMPGMAPTPSKANKDPIPEKYNTKSELTAEITESGTTEVNFELSSK